MNRHTRTLRHTLGAFALLPVALMISVLLPARPAAAHPLGVYLLAAYLTPAPSTIALDLNISPGVLVAPRALTELDTDDDRQISQTEARTYADRVLAQLHLRVDGQPLPLTITTLDVPSYLVVQAGYGTLRIHAQAVGAPAIVGSHEVFFRNDYAPQGAAYQINALIDNKAPVTLGKQHRDTTQQQSSIDYRIDTAAATTPSPAGTPQAVVDAPTDRLAGFLESSSLSVTVVLLALAMAAILGALHALTPGHAKTLMAAYLVGSGGTTRNALTLGAVVTFTHTASVIVIGLVALFASQFLVPGILVPALEILSGVLVLAIGLRLIRRRWPSKTQHSVNAHSHDHQHQPAREPALIGAQHHHTDHEHHHHEHADYAHSHGGRPHTHALPAGSITPRNLIAMGVSGGLVPCPEALGVMVLAVGVNRTVFGLGLIMSFSLGLAAVLMGLGVLLIKSRHLVSRFQRIGNRWTAVLPLVSALVVSTLGVGLLVKGVHAGLPLLH